MEQESIGKMYSEWIKCLLNEMDTYLDIVSVSKRTMKKFKYYKPFWDDELTGQWQEMRTKEKQFLQC